MTVTLTRRQAEVLDLIDRGFNTDDIAEELDVNRYGVRRTIRGLRHLLGAERMWDLPERAREHGLIS